ncbi:uncharacterized protein si:dkey-284p5.3 [Leucoraja erinacea]|uniref:uncharacterized protein si:dkey-284p5.3 n=1 Tax=Leucoraja erinaceus TaxID=7782 RepID=UPI0024546DF5|nr:uncharacterized protein si:dkey-284p5.3 [Leucoraja erinacea]
MGCSSSTQTQPQDSNRPNSKQEEKNGASKCASDVNGPITNEGETIPDHSQLLEPKAADTAPHEVVTNEPSPSEGGVHLASASEDSTDLVGLTTEEPESSAAPVEENTFTEADDIEEIQSSEDQIEGETGEKVECETAIEAKDEEEESEVEISEEILASGMTVLMSESKKD